MARWQWALLTACCSIMLASGSAVASDRAHAKSLTRSGVTIPLSSSRSCTGEDLPGTWSLVTFGSSYRFKNPQAPYLFPYQIFQYSREQGVKSAHSRIPLLDSPERVFEGVPMDLTYQVEPGGRVVLKTKGQDAAVEVWSCSVVGQASRAKNDGTALRPGDVVMTLLGSHGQALFVRHLRKSPA
ncbi:MAG: conserved exported protein of unknown function [Nitrospira sp.]|nr:hypothetical protein [Nitrospira sp.]ULA60796.1 MAG: conserved exported protein of unknown function [Nitrospira sp.]